MRYDYLDTHAMGKEEVEAYCACAYGRYGKESTGEPLLERFPPLDDDDDDPVECPSCPLRGPSRPRQAR